VSDHIVDLNMENAQSILIEESKSRPVLVNFWAEWNAESKTQSAALSALANDYAGQFLLANLDVDKENMIASQFGVQGLPMIMLMKDGQPIDGIGGPQDEPAIRELLSKYLPKQWDIEFEQAKAHSLVSEYGEALSLLKRAYESSQHRADISFEYARCLIELKRLDEAKTLLDAVMMSDQDAIYRELIEKLEHARENVKSSEVEALEERYRAASDDLSLALELVVMYGQEALYKDALELLYPLLQKDLSALEGALRKAYLDVLQLVGKSDPLAVKYQRKLYTLMY
jgi:putative thioredoxin